MAKTRIKLPESYYANQMEEKLNCFVSQLNLCVRTANMLDEAGYVTIRELLNAKQSDLLLLSNFGEKALNEVLQALKKFGFERKNTP